jgi:hypothetical protein
MAPRKRCNHILQVKSKYFDKFIPGAVSSAAPRNCLEEGELIATMKINPKIIETVHGLAATPKR